MKKFKIGAILFVMMSSLVSSSAWAANVGLMTYSATSKSVTFTSEAGTLTKAIPDGATATALDSTYPLTTVGSAVRDVSVFFTEHGYVAALMVKDATQYDKQHGPAAALASLENQQAVAITLTWQQTAPLMIVLSDFKASFTKNNTSFARGTAMDAFLTDVSKNGPGEANSTMTVLVTKNSADGTQSLVVENIAHGVANTQSILNSHEDLIQEIFSIWLGKTTDALLLKTQVQLLK